MDCMEFKDSLILAITDEVIKDLLYCVSLLRSLCLQASGSMASAICSLSIIDKEVGYADFPPTNYGNSLSHFVRSPRKLSCGSQMRNKC